MSRITTKRIFLGRLTHFLNCQEIQWFITLFTIQSLIPFPVTYNLIYPDSPTENDWESSPRQNTGCRFLLKGCPNDLKKVPIVIVSKYFFTRDSPTNDMMKGAGCVNSGSAWHADWITDPILSVKLINWERPLYYPFYAISLSTCHLHSDIDT